MIAPTIRHLPGCAFPDYYDTIGSRGDALRRCRTCGRFALLNQETPAPKDEPPAPRPPVVAPRLGLEVVPPSPAPRRCWRNTPGRTRTGRRS